MSNDERRNNAGYGTQGRDRCIHRSLLKNKNFSEHFFDGHPVLGIRNIWPETTPLKSGLRQMADGVKHRVWMATRPVAKECHR